jgi:hypothetical protein
VAIVLLPHRWATQRPPRGTPAGRGPGLANGLRACWPLSEGAGTILADAVGGLAYARPVNAPAWGTGTARDGGPNLVLNGSNQYATLPDVAALDLGGGPATLAASIRISAAGSYYVIVGGYSPAAPYAGYGLMITNTGNLAYWSGVTQAWVNSASATYNDGVWHLVGVSVAGTTARFYRDGLPDGSAATNEPNSFRGVRTLGATADGTNPFNGSLGPVWLWGRGLSDAEHAELSQRPWATCPPRPRRPVAAAAAAAAFRPAWAIGSNVFLTGGGPT